jgi:hypothetical protein
MKVTFNLLNEVTGKSHEAMLHLQVEAAYSPANLWLVKLEKMPSLDDEAKEEDIITTRKVQGILVVTATHEGYEYHFSLAALAEDTGSSLEYCVIEQESHDNAHILLTDTVVSLSPQDFHMVDVDEMRTIPDNSELSTAELLHKAALGEIK